MGGNLNELGGLSHTTGFSLFRPYDHVVVVYDGLDRVTSAIYYKSTDNSIILRNFVISYSMDGGHPIENGTEYKNHTFDIYQGRFTPCCDSSSGGGNTDECCGFTQIVRGTCNQAFTNKRYELLTNTKNSLVEWPLLAEKITCVSTSGEDSVGGTGIRTILLTGISTTGASQQEVVSLLGLTPVVSTLEYKRLNSAVSQTAGSNESAVGRISFTNSSLQILDTISAGFSRTASLKYTIPTTQELTLKAFRLNADRFGEYEVKLLIWARNPDMPVWTSVHTVANTQSDLHLFPGELTLAAETDLAAVVRKKSGANGAASLLTAELLGTQSLVI